ncbi:TetR/AcrR family transcriptional regulator [Dietzia sp. B32]|nr:TetR/AcrR family transcriptional regulator [Dietzia sp. B32]UVE93970.1 TetR/AcrR family transcriptional regulator [Dietzia sp. B32]
MTPTHAQAARPLQAPPPGSRRAEIALVAGEEFTRRGYHSTRVEHIADRLEVTPGALYRHVPGKYEMFRDAVAILISELESATGGAPVTGGDRTDVDEEDALRHVVESVTLTTLTHRSRASLYRWQLRYLSPEDRAAVVAADARVRGRVADAVRGRRRGGPTAGAGSAAGAILSCIASLGHHRIEITGPDAVTLMTSIADDLALCIPQRRRQPDTAARTGPPGAAPGSIRLRGGAATREGAISAAIELFHSTGYDGVTMEAIGADVGVAASALYRHFPGKAALLTAAVDRTAGLVGDLLDRHAAWHGAGTDPAGSLVDLLDQYIGIAFSHGPELMLYHSELGSLATEDRRRIQRAQRAQLDRWANLVNEASRAHGGTPPDEVTARLRVHAALSVVLDGGWGTGFDPAATARLGELARTLLLPR